MRYLVTGANGFIGSHVASRLESDHCDVVRVARIQSSRESARVVEADLSKPGQLQKAVEKVPDVIIHMAATLPRSFFGPEAEAAADSNRRVDNEVFTACSAWKIPVVYASSTSVYGRGDGRTISESSPTHPTGPYAACKLEGEATLRQLLGGRGTPCLILRINAPYGPGQKARTVLQVFIERALKGDSLLYHGSGTRQQDFTYIDDVVDAIVLAARAQKSGIYNISAGAPVTMKELAHVVRDCVPDCRSSVGPSGEVDPQEGASASFSTEKARAELGWVPRNSLREGITHCVRARMSQ